MYTRSMKGWGKHLDFLILDALMLELSLLLSYGIRHSWNFQGFEGIYRNLVLFVLACSILVGALGENYHGILRRDAFKEFRYAFLHVTLVEILLIVLAFFLKEFAYSREVFLVFWIIGTVLCWAARCLWRAVLKRVQSSRRKRRQVLLLTLPGKAKRVIRQWEGKQIPDCELCGVCLISPEEIPGKKKSQAGARTVAAERAANVTQEQVVRSAQERKDRLEREQSVQPEQYPKASAPANISKPSQIRGVPVIGTFSEIADYLLKHVVDEVLVQPGTILNADQMNDLLQAGLTVHINLEDLIKTSVPTYMEEFAGSPVLTSAMRIVRTWEMWIKRLMDIVGSLVGLAITGVACVFVVPAIKHADPGPAFFSQIRVGKNGRRFRMYKFRSMYQDAEQRKKELMAQNEMKGALFKIKDDPRIIKGIGQFIRKTSIDELPQFWNVLKGDMSLVGTRPPTEDEYNSYKMRYLRRLSIRPGITGIWQTSGRNSVRDFEDVIRMDTEYIYNWSLLLDIKLLCKTVKVVFTKDGAV